MASVTLDEPAANVNKIRQNTNGHFRDKDVGNNEFRKRGKGRDQRPSKLGNRPDQQTTGLTNKKPCK